MTEDSQEKKAILNFEDKKYEINSLDEDTKKILTGLRISDGQTKFYEDTLKLIATAKVNLVNDLKNRLKNKIPIED